MSEVLVLSVGFYHAQLEHEKDMTSRNEKKWPSVPIQRHEWPKTMKKSGDDQVAHHMRPIEMRQDTHLQDRSVFNDRRMF